MWKEQYVLVGDLFESFASHNENVLTRSDFYNMLECESLPERNVRIWIGQGVSRSDIESLIVSNGKPLSSFQILGNETAPKAIRSRTHKKRSQNVLVSAALKLSANQYELMLVLDEANEFLEDHMSGLHVQGMALVEASRQAFLSVTEQYYLSDTEMDFYFVINSIAIDYKSFLFPLPTRLRYQIISEKVRQNRMTFSVEIDLIQNDEVCAISRIDFSLFENKAIISKETKAAKKAVDRLIEHVTVSSSINTAA